ncbi:PaREP1/PaREP8 domain-contain protein [Candidatus Bathyarchaeota archaeon]|nr:MAG: PaREP1/PaREP8 domain-contain protein [Candidatus Bathyarchaeota archaeon]
MELVVGEPLAKYILDKARERGLTIEEFLAELVANELGREDRVRLYLELHGKYLAEAEELERKEDLTQAGEKLWGAVCSLLSALAEERGWRHYSHRDYCDIIERLAHELGEPELSVMFASAERLHANYYHGFLRPEGFKANKKMALALVEKLRKLLPGASTG